MKGLQELIKVTQKWQVFLEEKKSHVGILEHNLAFECSLGGAENSTDLRRYEKAQKLIELRAEIRKLKVDCLCLTQQVDLQGDHYLGDTELKSAPKKVVENGAPPVPPRPSPSIQVRPSFGILHSRVPPPSFPHRLQRPNQLQVTTCIVPRPNPIEEERKLTLYTLLTILVKFYIVGSMESRWSCSLCSFDNFPALKKCEMCETPRQSYSNLSEAIGGNQFVFYPIPVFYQQTVTAVDNNISHQLDNFGNVTNPHIDYYASHFTSHPINNISRDYDNNQLINADRTVTLVSCLSPSSCSSNTRCHCHREK